MKDFPEIFVKDDVNDFNNSYINYRLSGYNKEKQFDNLSEGYLQVAIKSLVILSNNNTYSHADIEIFPILFLINHSIECKLKSLAHTYHITDAKKGHNILDLLKKIESKTNKLDLKYTRHYIKAFNNAGWFKESPQLDITRYPISNKNKVYSHSEVIDKNIQISINNLLLISHEIKKEFQNISNILEEDIDFFK